VRALWVMIAGPYRGGASSDAERAANHRRLNEAAAQVLARGHVPVIGVNLALPIIAVAGPASYERIMMPLSLAVAERCDAVLRVGGPSAGADREVERIRALGGAVYERVEDLPAAAEDEAGPIDADLDHMSRAELVAEARKLRAGIRAHRDSSGHDLCWHHPALWGLLPERHDPLPRVPDWPQFLRGCIGYRQSLDEQLPGAPRTTDEADRRG
jgi:hypothetical protein